MRDSAVGRQASSKPIDRDHLVTVVRGQNTRHRSYGLLVLIVLHISKTMCQTRIIYTTKGSVSSNYMLAVVVGMHIHAHSVILYHNTHQFWPMNNTVIPVQYIHGDSTHSYSLCSKVVKRLWMVLLSIRGLIRGGEGDDDDWDLIYRELTVKSMATMRLISQPPRM